MWRRWAETCAWRCLLVEDIVALAVMRLRRPVKLEFTRTEQVTAATTRLRLTVTVTAGARRDGTLTALRLHVADTGAHGNHGPGVLFHGCGDSMAVYLCTGVRRVELATGQVQPLLLRDKTLVPPGAEEEMRGEGRQAVLSPDRTRLYKLYLHQADHEHTRDLLPGAHATTGPQVHAFVHVLSLTEG